MGGRKNRKEGRKRDSPSDRQVLDLREREREGGIHKKRA